MKVLHKLFLSISLCVPFIILFSFSVAAAEPGLNNYTGPSLPSKYQFNLPSLPIHNYDNNSVTSFDSGFYISDTGACYYYEVIFYSGSGSLGVTRYPNTMTSAFDTDFYFSPVSQMTVSSGRTDFNMYVYDTQGRLLDMNLNVQTVSGYDSVNNVDNFGAVRGSSIYSDVNYQEVCYAPNTILSYPVFKSNGMHFGLLSDEYGFGNYAVIPSGFPDNVGIMIDTFYPFKPAIYVNGNLVKAAYDGNVAEDAEKIFHELNGQLIPNYDPDGRIIDYTLNLKASGTLRPVPDPSLDDLKNMNDGLPELKSSDMDKIHFDLNTSATKFLFKSIDDVTKNTKIRVAAISILSMSLVMFILNKKG